MISRRPPTRSLTRWSTIADGREERLTLGSEPSQVRGFVTGRKSPPPTRSFLMSDLDSIATPSIDWAIVTAQSAAREALATALLPVNKTALFDEIGRASCRERVCQYV